MPAEALQMEPHLRAAEGAPIELDVDALEEPFLHRNEIVETHPLRGDAHARQNSGHG
jgi:hypothetical protein